MNKARAVFLSTVGGRREGHVSVSQISSCIVETGSGGGTSPHPGASLRDFITEDEHKVVCGFASQVLLGARVPETRC